MSDTAPKPTSDTASQSTSNTAPQPVGNTNAAPTNDATDIETTKHASEDASTGANTSEDASTSSNSALDPRITELIDKAQKAYEADDSKTVAECCDEILKIDSENFDAWELLAKFGAWDSKMLEMDVLQAVAAAKRATELAPEGVRYDLGSKIYTARKKQIAAQLESSLMMPSYQGAKKVHAIMHDWEQLLVKLPYLTPSLIEGEINLCTNLCKRSKMGIMPADRLVYTAYATFNKKENYGDTFRKALMSRIEGEAQQTAGELESARKEIEDNLAQYKQRRESGELSPAEEKALLEKDLANITISINNLVGMSNRSLYADQLEEMKKQLAKLKPYKLVKRQEMNRQIAAVENKIAEIDSQLEINTASLKAQADLLQQRLTEIEAEL